MVKKVAVKDISVPAQIDSSYFNNMDCKYLKPKTGVSGGMMDQWP